MTTSFLGELVSFFLYVMMWLVIARSLTSWFPNSRQNRIVELLYQVTDPILVPLGRLIPRIGMIDISPMVAVLVLIALRWWLEKVL